MPDNRNPRRASSRAHHPCPVCGRRQNGFRGVEAHLATMHPDDRDAAARIARPAAAATLQKEDVADA